MDYYDGFGTSKRTHIVKNPRHALSQYRAQARHQNAGTRKRMVAFGFTWVPSVNYEHLVKVHEWEWTRPKIKIAGKWFY